MNIWKSRGDSSQRRERVRREEVRKERIRRKKIRAREKAEKSRSTGVVPMFCGSGGSKSRLAKAAAAEPSSQMRGQKLHAQLWSIFGC